MSSDRRDVLITHALGSCIGLTLFDPDAGVGALLHAQMPLSSASPERACHTPAMYVDSGVAYVLEHVLALGATRGTLVACVAGGAQHFVEGDVFEIGRRNYTVVRKMLWKNGILIAGQDVGGQVTRTLVLDMASGRTTLRVAGTDRDLYPGSHTERRSRQWLLRSSWWMIPPSPDR